MAYYSLVFGVITILGGILGYTKGSDASLIAGLTCGSLLLGFGYAYLKGKAFGFYGLLLVSAALGMYFLNAFLTTGRVMPAAIMVMLGFVNVIGLLRSKRRRPTESPR